MKQDGTYEEKLDVVLIELYRAFINSKITGNLTEAGLYNTQFVKPLESKFGDANLNIDGFLARLEVDGNIRKLKRNEGEQDKYKIEPKGVDFIENGDSYVEMKIRDKEKRDLENNLLRSQIETNRISKSTNIFIAIFTGTAGLWYFHDLLDKMILDCWEYKYLFINLITITIAACFLVGILAYLYKAHKQPPKNIEKEQPNSQ